MTDSYLKEFEAEVVSVKDGKYIVLDKTAFYPDSGGQPHDTGMLAKAEKEFRVIFVGKFDGKISHEVDTEGLKTGDMVKGRIDWERRYMLMRMHTAAHILCEMVHRKSRALITGNQLGTDKSRIDFSLEDFDKELIAECITEANKITDMGLPVKVYFMPKEQAMKIENISKLVKGFPEHLKEIRIVEIVGYDIQADGGTHVRNTKEVGHLEFVEAVNKGRSNRRVYFRIPENYEIQNPG